MRVCVLQALQDILQDPGKVSSRKARREILNIFVKPRIPEDAGTSSNGSSSSSADIVKELCATEACLRPLVQPLQPKLLDRLQLLERTRELAALDPSSVRLFKFRADVKASVPPTAYS
jgi:hypothetical protein